MRSIHSFALTISICLALPCVAQENLEFKIASQEGLIGADEVKGTGNELYLNASYSQLNIFKLDLSDISSTPICKNIQLIDKSKKEYFFGGANKDTIVYFNGMFASIYDTWSKSTKKKTIYYRVYDKNGAPVLTDPKELFSVDCNKDMENSNSTYTLCFSGNRSKIALLFVNGTNKPQPEYTLISVNAKDGSVGSTNKINGDYNGSKFSAQLETMDDAGNTELTFYTLDQNNKVIQRYWGQLKPNEGAFSGVKEFPLDKTKNRYSSIEEKSNDGKLIVSGMYSSMSGPEDGTFYAVIDSKTKKVITETYTPFSGNTASMLGYKLKIKGEKSEAPGSRNFVSRHFVTLNGNRYLVAEHSVESIGADKLYYNISMEVLVSKYNAEGKNEWQAVIPKQTYPGRNPGMSSGSFQLLEGKNELYVLFLDHEENEKTSLNNYSISDYKPIKRSYGANVACVKVTEKGELSKSILFKNPEQAPAYVPNMSTIKRENVYLVSYQSLDDRRFATITVK
jgi:hypothetical protein